MKILLFTCTAALLIAQGLSAVLVQPAKPGETVTLELGDKVMDVQAAIQEAVDDQKDRMDIIKNRSITDYGVNFTI